jgi:hypothetical protein
VLPAKGLNCKEGWGHTLNFGLAHHCQNVHPQIERDVAPGCGLSHGDSQPDSTPGIGESEYSHQFEVWSGVSYSAAANMYAWGKRIGDGSLQADAKSLLTLPFSGGCDFR